MDRRPFYVRAGSPTSPMDQRLGRACTLERRGFAAAGVPAARFLSRITGAIGTFEPPGCSAARFNTWLRRSRSSVRRWSDRRRKRPARTIRPIPIRHEIAGSGSQSMPDASAIGVPLRPPTGHAVGASSRATFYKPAILSVSAARRRGRSGSPGARAAVRNRRADPAPARRSRSRRRGSAAPAASARP